MNAEPERICEALEWLYGGEWALSYSPSSVHLIFKNKHGDLVEWMDGAADLQEANNDSGFGVPVNDRLAHALAVTAPWEWTGPQKKVCNIPNGTGRANVAVGDPHEGDYQWYLDLDGGKLSIDGECESLGMAKKTARAAYLCWMRGRFAMKGGEA